MNDYELTIPPLFNKEAAMHRAKLGIITENDVEALDVLYKRLHAILNRPTFYVEEKNAVELVRGLEIAIQHLWGFEFNPDMLYYEFKLKGCTCDPMKGSSMYRNFGNCPFHNSEEK